MRIQLTEVRKEYGNVPALDRVNLEFAPGQIIAVLGVNGAGKSTLLRCLAGVAAPDSGEVRYDGIQLRRDDVALRKRLYFMPDFPPLFLTETVARNVGIIVRLYEVMQPDIGERVAELLEDFDLLPLIDSFTATLSRGQSYKVSLAAGFAVQPELWLLDEPFASGMDPHALQSFRRRAREAAAAGATIVYTTQLLELAETFSDQVCVMHQGQVKAFEPMAKLRAGHGGRDGALESLLEQLRESAV